MDPSSERIHVLRVSAPGILAFPVYVLCGHTTADMDANEFNRPRHEVKMPVSVATTAFRVVLDLVVRAVKRVHT
jgi:hypothetical protein